MKDIETEARKIYPAAKTIRITPQLQPDLVGGVALTIIDRRLDLTTKAKLQQFKMLAINGKE
jgi:F0F1-type ATP synthase delta subunit